MILTAPMPFKEALDANEVRALLPTTGRTRDLQQLSGAVKRRALFSATVTSAELLQKLQDSTQNLLTGTTDQATMRLGIKQLLEQMGYQPDPEKIGGLQDLSSTKRINLQLETLTDTARGYGWDLQGQDPDVLDEFPAQELIRDFAPKGAERDWAARWAKCGGEFFNGRMIALKNDPIWSKLGDPELFDDGLGNPYPPFAYNSGMGVRDIARDEAEQLGLIDPNQEVFPRDLSFNQELEATPDVRDARLRAMLESSGLGTFNSDGAFVFNDGEGGP
ncbi:MAG: hypothetical protein KF715_08625 [Candidatus Didemnitutus sp.]|nr:hypothetical protein [Candidatus Didemnitutus sp.]